jgi:hypothetical protein
MTIRSSGTIPLGVVRQELGGGAQAVSIGAQSSDILLGENQHPRALSRFYGAKAFRYSSNAAIFNWNPGDAVYIDYVLTGGWDNGGFVIRHTAVNGVSYSWSQGSGTGGKADYWGATFDGSTISSTSAYYAGGSTNYAWASIAVVRIQYLGPGHTSTHTSLGLYPSTYYNSSYYLGSTI